MNEDKSLICSKELLDFTKEPWRLRLPSDYTCSMPANFHWPPSTSRTKFHISSRSSSP